ncbi:MAG: protein phosphatase 2C domain-containing protein [Clostridia bacterium]|jgi:serine/threonine protein phosphatase PrpC|nr:protein phosphatase 2C domain-containing protein [Clostridia bacterium]
MLFSQIKKGISNLIPKTTSVLAPQEDTANSNSTTNTTESVAAPSIQKPERKVISFTHIGADHIFAGVNNQDYKLCGPNMKFVFDGCGSGASSEVGSRLFVQLFMQEGANLMQSGTTIGEENFEEIVKKVFERLTALSNDPDFVFNNYCFTILACFETDNEYVVMSCGDGFIILDDGKNISFQKLDDGEYPKYYIYNYIEDKELLKEYQDGVSFTVNRFSKQTYQTVGVATDGLRFYSELTQEDQLKFARALHMGNIGLIEKIINLCNSDKTLLVSLYRYYQRFTTEQQRQTFLKYVPQLRNFENRSKTKFHDDITICF